MSSRLLAGRYELLAKIGDGGMAVVYKAKCRVLNRFVAIKILKPEFTKDMKFIENFRRESQSAAGLNHPNIVNVYDVGREGNINYIVMELIEGKVLSDIINQEGPLEPKRAIAIAKQIALALSFAHKNQIIHRDVKPHNILLTQNGIAKITDFGIAKAVNSATIVGQTGTVMGSVHYFSPEQARGGYVDDKSDIYSLGIVLYEMLTGRVPFNADNPVAVAVMHMNELMVPPSRYMPSIPPELEAVVMKATDKYQTNRYKNADEMYEALDRAAFSMLGLQQNAQYMNQMNDQYSNSGSNTDSKGLGATMTMAAINNNRPEEVYGAGEEDEEINMRDKGKKKEKKEKKAKGDKGSGKKKFRFNKIKVFAVVLALICAIPASHFVLTAFEGFGKDKEIKVPDVVGMTLEQAEKALEDEGLKFEIGEEIESSEYEEGRIVHQTPDADMTVKKGQTVTLDVSTGLVDGTIPDVTNKSLDSAVFLLQNAGYDKGRVIPEDSDLPKDMVISQDPEPGTEAKPGTKVNLTVSSGSEEMIKMPNLIGLTQAQAEQKLKDEGLLPGKVSEEESSKYDKDTVMWQQYGAGEEMEPDTKVNFTICLGVPEPEGPKTIGLTVDYSSAPNEVVFLTVIVNDELGTGRTIYNAEQKLRSSGSETLSIKGQGKGTITVIFDNTEVMKKNVDFSTGA